MISEPVTITEKPEKRASYQRHELWRFGASDGRRYMTTDVFVASLASRAFEQSFKVKIEHLSGWWYRNAVGMEREDGTERV